MAEFAIYIGRVALRTARSKSGNNGEGFPLKFYFIVQNLETHRILNIQKEMGLEKYEESIIEALRGLGSIVPKKFYNALESIAEVSHCALMEKKFSHSLENPDYNVATLYWDDMKQVLVVVRKGVADKNE